MSLLRLTIDNIVLIDHLVIDFHDGLGVLTGETGAGKSVLLDSLGLALGERSESGLVRKGAEKANVVAEFDLPSDHSLFDFLNENDIECARGEPVILRRSLTADGRSRAFVNDGPVSVSLLKQIGSYLVEIHGQFATQGLLDASTHRTMLDEYAVIGGELAKLWQDYKIAMERYEEAKSDIESSRAEEDYLRGAIEDLDAIEPKPGEESALAQAREQLMNREKIMEALNLAYQFLNREDDPVGRASSALLRAGIESEKGNAILEALDRAAAEMEEARAGLQSLSADLSDEDRSLEDIDERLFSLRAQARKHGCSVDDLALKREDMARKLNAIEHAEDVLADMIRARDDSYAAYKAEALKVSAARQTAAAKLDKAVVHELEPLKLGKARFVTAIEILPETQWGAQGMESVRFLVATNPGQDPAPLQKVASGGEMSRFMLALKVVMAQVGAAETLIFDEVDAGVGGSTADAIGERLSKLAATHQVLVVTHAPQVAARSAHHYVVEKSGSDMVSTDIRYLKNAGERAEEIARMLAGAQITDEARAAAHKLMEATA
jgi:DNA repair protein RecN (Recombination protein N)